MTILGRQVGTFPGYPGVHVTIVDDHTRWMRVRFYDLEAVNDLFSAEAHREIHNQLARYAQSQTIWGWATRLYIVTEPEIAILIERWIEGAGWNMDFGRFARLLTLGEDDA